MDDLEQALLVSAYEALNIESYWPECDTSEEWDDSNDEEFPIFLSFYEQVLDCVNEESGFSEQGVTEAIRHLVCNYGKLKDGRTPNSLDYEDLRQCLAYLHRYAACHAALVRSVLVRVFHTCPPGPVRRMLSLKQNLKVLSLGGGPGCDALGFLSALYGRHYGLEKLEISILDSGSAWGLVINGLIELLRRGDLGNASAIVSELKAEMTFLCADMKDQSVRQVLNSTDIILLSKVLSVVDNKEKDSLLQHIVSNMKPGSMIIVVDTPFPEAAFTSQSKYLEQIYAVNRNKFCFNYEVNRFGFNNITQCHAHVRVYIRTLTTIN